MLRKSSTQAFEKKINALLKKESLGSVRRVPMEIPTTRAISKASAETAIVQAQAFNSQSK